MMRRRRPAARGRLRRLRRRARAASRRGSRAGRCVIHEQNAIAGYYQSLPRASRARACFDAFPGQLPARRRRASVVGNPVRAEIAARLAAPSALRGPRRRAAPARGRRQPGRGASERRRAVRARAIAGRATARGAATRRANAASTPRARPTPRRGVKRRRRRRSSTTWRAPTRGPTSWSAAPAR